MAIAACKKLLEILKLLFTIVYDDVIVIKIIAYSVNVVPNLQTIPAT